MSKSRSLKAWELLVLSIVLFVVGQYVIGGPGGGVIAIVGQIFFLFSIVAFVRERRSKKRETKD